MHLASAELKQQQQQQQQQQHEQQPMEVNWILSKQLHYY